MTTPRAETTAFLDAAVVFTELLVRYKPAGRGFDSR